MRKASKPAREILAYFLRNPHAADSLEGIARWRLLEEAIHCKVIETRAALEWLVSEGFLMETSLSASGKLYQLNPEKRDQAEVLLKKPSKRTARKRGRE